MEHLRILLLQARQMSDSARVEERSSFARLAGLNVEQMVAYDLLAGTPSLAEVRQYDALMVGGSGDYYVSKQNLPYHQAVLALLREVVAAGHPLFASCFGFQLMVAALGGEVVYDPENMEVGTYPLQLTAAGRADELFCSLPAEFMAQLGHKDRAERLPEATVSLAFSRQAPTQALRIPGQPIWATQFHPELTRETNLGRFRRYMDGYATTMDPAELQKTFDRFHESPETEQLLPGFLEIVFG